MRLRSESLLFTLFLSALGGVTPLSIDMGLPALTSIGHSLHVSAASAGLTLSFFLGGFALGPLIFGPLSDRYGRRPVLLAGTFLFAVAGAGCTIAHSLPWLLFWRLFAGMGAGSSSNLVLAIVRDLFDGITARVRLSYVSTVATLAPMIAPTLGAIILSFAGWRTIYGSLAVMGFVLLAVIALFFDETLREKHLHALEPRRVLINYGRFFGHPICLGYAVAMSLNFGALFSYVSSSPLVMMGVLGVSPMSYGWTFAATSLGIMAGALTNGRLSAYAVPSSTLIPIGLITSALCALAIFGLSHTSWGVLGTLLPLLVLNAFCLGLISPNANQGAMHPLPDMAGLASSILGSSRMMIGALASVFTAMLYDGHTAHAMGLMMSLFSLAALLAYYGIVRPAERRPVPLAIFAAENDVGPESGSP
jgi:DHA1 family bicyclomycin/chloramphenicol resistance-like MFS transporter